MIKAPEIKLSAEPLTKKNIPELINAAGPCITLLLPPYRPGEPGKPAAALIKKDLLEAEKALAARRIAAPLIGELLEPLYRLCHGGESLAGMAWSRAIFRSEHVSREFELPIFPIPAGACVVGDCFWIRPILASLALPANIYVLDLTKKSAVLLACGWTGVNQVELPAGTPQTLDEAFNFDAPDHDLMNRSAAGPSCGAMRGVQFGTGPGREIQRAHLHDFYRAVDRGVNELLRTSVAPLVLAGVDAEMAIYRSVSTYPNLLEPGIHGSPGAAIGPAQMLRHAHEIALFSLEQRVALEMAAAREQLAPARFFLELDSILRAAVEGRVQDLYLDDNGREFGTFDAKIFGGHANWHDEDLLNVAAMETLLHGGAVHSLPSHWMPRGAVAAAALRF
jgi:hypothetical protein